jgi:hypothetical protein
MHQIKRVLSVYLAVSIALATSVEGVAAQENDLPSSAANTTPVLAAEPTAQDLQQLVAPIALYPDALVAQVLAASTYPDQVVQADRWLQAHPELNGDQLAQSVDQQPWDPSVKALVEFPSILANMDKNLSWTSSLGDAYINDQQAVMTAVQTMRQNAKDAGNLNDTPQQKVSEQGQTIVIEPASPDIVYVPQYDPWIAYGYPVAPWPGWYWYPGLYWRSPGIAFGVGFGVGFFSGFGWGWHHWAPDWHHRAILFNHSNYISHSRAFVNRNYYVNRARINPIHNGPGGFRGADGFRGGTHPVVVPRSGFETPHAPAAGHVGAFGGFNHGGVVRGYSQRGFSSMGGNHGGGFHGGHR